MVPLPVHRYDPVADESKIGMTKPVNTPEEKAKNTLRILTRSINGGFKEQTVPTVDHSIKINKSITRSMVLGALLRSNTSPYQPGICVECGNEQDDCPSHGVERKCDACEHNTVFGIEELIKRYSHVIKF